MEFKTTNYYEFIKQFNIFNADLLNEDNLNQGPNQLKRELNNVWSILRILQDKPAFEWQPNIVYQPGEIVYFTRQSNPDLGQIKQSYYMATDLVGNNAKVPDTSPTYWKRIHKIDIIPDFDTDNYIKKTNNTSWIPSQDYDPINLKFYNENINARLNYSLQNYIRFDNTAAWTPTHDYNPVPKVYVDKAFNILIGDGTVHNANYLKNYDGSEYIRVNEINKMIVKGSDYNYIRTTTQGFLPGAANTTIGSLTETFKEIHARDFVGTATRARYADLAEFYNADKHYEPGTVLAVGGENEVTLYKQGMPLAGVVSEKPGLVLNDMNTECKTLIALKGRVKVRVSNDVQKGDYIYPDNNGLAKGSKQLKCNDRIGIAISDSFNGYVLAKV